MSNPADEPLSRPSLSRAKSSGSSKGSSKILPPTLSRQSSNQSALPPTLSRQSSNQSAQSDYSYATDASDYDYDDGLGDVSEGSEEGQDTPGNLLKGELKIKFCT